ncbi:hypothetical protein PX860_27330 (plasmid) [Agrobacterium leguminum]|uniref:hypothetical protein n=1 Tax=Agrobacterium leguminum TaxID=2792015 RepID=UPI00272D5A0B|nr:hypothetical protein [Agrobacterium leguminum]WLE00848.1 hypothetical protein PX860_27330 [Agrobacterium leguminum]
MQIRRKSRQGRPHSHLAHSLYSAELGAHDPGRYRRTPPCAPDVAALVQPGMTVRTSYGTGGIVVAVEGPTVHHGRDGREYPHFTIIYVPAKRFGRHSAADHCWLNECVAVGGRILMLLEANDDEVFVEASSQTTEEGIR